MKKEIKTINERLGIMRITTLDERWYAKPSDNKKTGLPEYEYKPSSTWIAGYYPKGVGFYKWLADKGWDEAEAIKQAAGDKGSKVHQACMDLDSGMDIDIQHSKYMNNTSGQEEELTKEEVDCILSYRNFIEAEEMLMLGNEITGFGEFYAGTTDKIFAQIGKDKKRQIWIVDLKTGQYIWEEYYLQIASYSHMEINWQTMGISQEEWDNRKLAVLQIGYKKNKNGYKFTEIEDKFDMFQNVAYRIWQNENPDAKPREKDYPLIISSDFRKKQLKVEGIKQDKK